MSEKSTLNQNFRDFGNNMYMVGVFLLINIIASLINSYIGIGTRIIQYVFLFMALAKIKTINEELNNSFLASYYSKILLSIIFALVGGIVTDIMTILSPMTPMEILQYFRNYGTLPPGTMSRLALQGVFALLTYIAFILEYIGYKALSNFFYDNSQMFPALIGRDAAEGASKLKTAALMNILFFLLITLLIGLIYSIIGYFAIGNTLKKLDLTPMPRPGAMYGEPTLGAVNSKDVFGVKSNMDTTDTTIVQPKFCRKCGSPLPEGIEFCPSCGAKVRI